MNERLNMLGMGKVGTPLRIGVNAFLVRQSTLASPLNSLEMLRDHRSRGLNAGCI